ncbi:MAG: hypothetical protein HY778_11205 [Betaproteobacteria bacterium]|nr:hypothetical protein [Betaproteobacteria bacterium]
MNPRLALLVVLTIVAGLALDARGGVRAQAVVDGWAWAVFAVLLIRGPATQRPALLACLAIATAGEVLLSLIWGLYDYRLGNIPLFVPPGHVLLYALGLWLAPRLPQWTPAATAALAGVVAVALAAAGVDGLSLPLTALFVLCVRYGPAPRLYAVMFLLALAMELWGTWLGNWAWRPVTPWSGWATLNPPFAAGAFYCVLDWLVGRAAGRSGAAPGRAPARNRASTRIAP